MALSPYWYDFDRHRRWLESRFFKPEDWNFPLSEWHPWRNWPNAPSHQLRDDTTTITHDKDKFQISVDVQHFAPEEISVKTTPDGFVVIEGKHEEKRDDHGFVSRQFQRRYNLPEGCLADTVQSALSSDGVLTVTAPKKLALADEGERIVPIAHTGPVHRKLQIEENK